MGGGAGSAAIMQNGHFYDWSILWFVGGALIFSWVLYRFILCDKRFR